MKEALKCFISLLLCNTKDFFSQAITLNRYASAWKFKCLFLLSTVRITNSKHQICTQNVSGNYAQYNPGTNLWLF